MRNLFDQYTQPENRLTHALAVALDRDRSLLLPFLRWAGATAIPPSRRLRVVEQQVPGERESGGEAEAERRGLPDACIFDDDGWAVVIESKVQARIGADQLRRHHRTAARHGFRRPHVMVLSVDPPFGPAQRGIAHRQWRDLYAWLRGRAGGSAWARTLLEYLEVFESRMIADEYSIRGTITMFSGLHFDDESPYTYREGKRLIRLLGDELQKRKDLHKLGVDPAGTRRTAITGRGSDRVWDFLPLKRARGAAAFTAHPHLTMGIHANGAVAAITIPNGVSGGIRRRLDGLGRDGFRDLLLDLDRRTRPILRRAPGSKVRLHATQRHYRSQRSEPDVDAVLRLDLRTLAGGGGVKRQAEWADAVYSVLVRKRSNIQVAIEAEFPHSCPALRSPKAVDLFADTWKALWPWAEVAIDLAPSGHRRSR